MADEIIDLKLDEDGTYVYDKITKVKHKQVVTKKQPQQNANHIANKHEALNNFVDGFAIGSELLSRLFKL